MMVFAKFTDNYFKSLLVIPLDKIISIEKNPMGTGTIITLVDGSQRFPQQTVEEITEYLENAGPSSRDLKLNETAN